MDNEHEMLISEERILSFIVKSSFLSKLSFPTDDFDNNGTTSLYYDSHMFPKQISYENVVECQENVN